MLHLPYFYHFFALILRFGFQIFDGMIQVVEGMVVEGRVVWGRVVGGRVVEIAVVVEMVLVLQTIVKVLNFPVVVEVVFFVVRSSSQHFEMVERQWVRIVNLIR